MGELLRRYWQPVCTSDELTRPAAKVKSSCARRSSSSATRRAGSARSSRIARTAAPRSNWAASRSRGIRCCYHGWLYDTQGHCIDMPCETEEFRQKMDVWQPAYPAHGIWRAGVPLHGPARHRAAAAAFRHHRPGTADDVVLRGMRLWGDYAVGYVSDCNWLQHWENIVDPVPPGDAAPVDQRRPVQERADAGQRPGSSG